MFSALRSPPALLPWCVCMLCTLHSELSMPPSAYLKSSTCLLLFPSNQTSDLMKQVRLLLTVRAVCPCHRFRDSHSASNEGAGHVSIAYCARRLLNVLPFSVVRGLYKGTAPSGCSESCGALASLKLCRLSLLSTNTHQPLLANLCGVASNKTTQASRYSVATIRKATIA